MKQLIILLALFSFNVYAGPVDINNADADIISQSLKGISEKKVKNNMGNILLSITKVSKKAKTDKKVKKEAQVGSVLLSYMEIRAQDIGLLLCF